MRSYDGLKHHVIDTRFHEDWLRHSNTYRGDIQTKQGDFLSLPSFN
jgi:hypothetical protein